MSYKFVLKEESGSIIQYPERAKQGEKKIKGEKLRGSSQPISAQGPDEGKQPLLPLNPLNTKQRGSNPPKIRLSGAATNNVSFLPLHLMDNFYSAFYSMSI